MPEKPSYEELKQRVKELEKESIELKKVKEALRESERRFHHLVEHATDAFLLHDLDGRIIDVNQHACESLGYTREELLALSIHDIDLDFFPGKHLERWEQLVPGEPIAFEGVHRRKDGTTFPVEVRLGAFEPDKRRLMLGLVRDISERKRVEEALKESEQKYKTLTENSLTGVFIIQDEKYVFVNDRFAEIHGYKPEEMLGKEFLTFIHPDQRDIVKQRASQRLKGEAVPQRYEIQRLRKDGKTIWCETMVTCIQYRGSPAIMGNMIDIDEIKRSHEALRESEEQFRHLSEAAFEGIAIHEEGILLKTNDQFFEIFGYEPQELLGKQAIPITIAPESMELVKKQIRLGATTPYEVMGLKKDGTKFPMEIYAKPFEYQGRMVRVAAFRDISDRKQAEEALRESEERYRSLYESSQDGIAGRDMEGNIHECNQAFLDMLGYTREGINKLTYQQLTPAKWHKMEADIVKSQIIARGYSDEYEKEYIRKDGTIFPVSCRVWLRKDEKGEPVGMWGIARDITEHKLAEEALRESKEQIRLTVENAPLGIGAVHLDGRFRSMNQAYCDMLGYSSEELLNMTFDDITHPDDKENSHKTFKGLLEGKVLRLEFDKRYIRKDGSIIDVIQRGAVVHDLSGNPLFIIGISEDVTEKRKLEAQLQQVEKMEAIGTLAGGIAHNFNNLLMGIMGSTSLMLLETDSNHPNYEKLINIEKQVQRGSNLTSKLLGYAREGRYEIRPISLNQLVEDTSDTFGTTRKEIRVHQELAKDLSGIDADQGQIEQVLLNLYINAADAMPGGGDLLLKTMNMTHKDMRGKPYTAKPGNYVLLTVRDTGIGMDKRTMERIFEPFFTTKEMGRGTGLGLASVYGIIKAHGGYIDVDSKKGQGTTFEIYLPASEKKVIEEKEVPVEVLRGTETVLLVDDEDTVIEVGEQMLSRLGYKVLLARGGREALELYKKNQDKINMVLLDMIMPDMGGGETHDRMRKINPDIRVLLSSGYGIDGQATEILERGCDGFIQKPFNIEQLSQSIRKILYKK